MSDNKRVSIAHSEMVNCFWLGLLFTIGGVSYGLYDNWADNGELGPVYSVAFGVFLLCYSVYQRFKHKRLKDRIRNAR
jgi:hypothetical protein